MGGWPCLCFASPPLLPLLAFGTRVLFSAYLTPLPQPPSSFPQWGSADCEIRSPSCSWNCSGAVQVWVKFRRLLFSVIRFCCRVLLLFLFRPLDLLSSPSALLPYHQILKKKRIPIKPIYRFSAYFPEIVTQSLSSLTATMALE